MRIECVQNPDPAPGEPDAELRVHDSAGGAPASAALWWRSTPMWAGAPTVFLGGYRCDPGCDDAASMLLAECGRVAVSASPAATLIGPVDGSTWANYRWVTWRGREPVFPLEPDHPDAWRIQFEAAGFRPCAQYHSSVCENLHAQDSRLGRVRERLTSMGVQIRPMDAGHPEEDLRALHGLSLRSFRGNVLYSDLPWELFRARYAGRAESLERDLVWLAERDGALVGFVFGYRCPSDGATPPTAVLKTLAVEPGRLWAGLGGVLLERFHEAAAAGGCQRVIHALMEDGNASRNLSARHSRIIRRYALYARPLAS